MFLTARDRSGIDVEIDKNSTIADLKGFRCEAHRFKGRESDHGRELQEQVL